MKKHSGFTLIEISIVVAIIAILTAVTLVVFNNIQEQSRDTARSVGTRSIMAALSKYYDANGEYPSACPGGDNSGCPITNLAASLVPRYIPAIPADPSGATSQYVRGTYPNKAYGIIIYYEATSTCKTGVTVNTGWWGSTIPICTDPAPSSA